MRHFEFSNDQQWHQHLPRPRRWCFFLLLLTALSMASETTVLMGQGIVSVGLSSRGDWSIIGDNQSNTVRVSEVGDDIIVEGLSGTMIRRTVPSLPERTSSSISIPKSMLFFVRNVTIDLKQGNDRILVYYLPEVISGSLTGRLGNGANYLGLFPNDAVEILNGISIRGSRSSLPHYVVLGDTDFSDPNIIYCFGEIEIELKGAVNAVGYYSSICDQDVSIKTAGDSSQVECAWVGVEGKMNLRVASSFSSVTQIDNGYFAGKTNLTYGNGSHQVLLVETNWDGEVVGKFGRGNDELSIIDCVFNHPNGATFDGGRGENFYQQRISHSGFEAVFKSFFPFP